MFSSYLLLAALVLLLAITITGFLLVASAFDTARVERRVLEARIEALRRRICQVEDQCFHLSVHQDRNLRSALMTKLALIRRGLGYGRDRRESKPILGRLLDATILGKHKAAAPHQDERNGQNVPECIPEKNLYWPGKQNFEHIISGVMLGRDRPDLVHEYHRLRYGGWNPLYRCEDHTKRTRRSADHTSAHKGALRCWPRLRQRLKH